MPEDVRHRRSPRPAAARAIGVQIARALRGGARAWLVLALVIVSLGGLAAGLAPLTLKILVDRLSAGATPSLALLAPGVGAYVGALLVQRLCEQIQSYAYFRGEQRLVRRFGAQTYAHILALPLPFHLDNKSGALAQALADGVLGLRLLLTHAILSIAPVLIQVVVACVVLGAVLGPGMALVLLVSLASYAAVFAWSAFGVHGAVKGISAAQGDVGGATADGLLNIEAIKAFTAEQRYARRYDALLEKTEAHWRRYLARRLAGGLAVAGVFALAMTATHLLASLQVLRAGLTLGAFVLINTYLLQLIRPLEMLGFAVRDIGQALAYLDRIGAILTEPAEGETGARESALPAPSTPAELVFDEVSFAYPGRQTLDAVSFRAAPGQTIGIVGPSGAGKSTLLRLALRFLEPSAGQIRLDGAPLDDLSLAALRRQIALVSQDTILFNDTIAANIALAADDADPKAIAEAAEAARLAPLLAILPDGLQTRVGERGLKLSGGEKQRVSIARAALKKARLVIFDEATAALDPGTERAVWEAMAGLSQGATTLVVTHRLATVAGADEILVLEAGRVVERGRHGALLAMGGVYARLWRAQAFSVAPVALDDRASLASSL
ncbi:ATP-binding cassette domain-containing protein [Caulobacter sp. RL271]|uniref:ABC transporter ATP-binding protein/permease n=1 Tax=Caulobacter segnis TaxID=88688 RepID=A0ABY4ZRP8_9CAUL|nr:ABC transporter ATP-binding protein [Caulobacter segnis]USQ95299.1 ABC transporter ATP-binding protein/permease [Caulobacter segnis]